jgi:putative transcriptional regulator
VPEHTHKGFELTLLLDGEFEDEMGKYVKGDFICLDSAHKHSPQTTQGCLCLTVVNDALQFTKGMSKLLNPFGNLIY